MARPVIYLGRIAVVPRKGLKAWVENTLLGEEVQGESGLYEQLREIFALAPAETAEILNESDLCLDVALAGRSSGAALELDLGRFAFLALWRPKIELRARLTKPVSGKAVKNFAITERPSWREYLWRRAFLFGLLFGGIGFDQRNMEMLLNRASLRLLKAVAKAAYR